jgi:predicted enzyme related to lactoylglutathione lyase
MHRNLLSTLVIDAPPDARTDTVAFWAGALGAEAVQTRMPQYTILEGAAHPNRVVVQEVGSGHAGVHFDIHTDDLDAEVARLVGLGAVVVDDSWKDHPGAWVIMRDPAGMEFCVVWALNPIRPQADRDDFERRAKEVG